MSQPLYAPNLFWDHRQARIFDRTCWYRPVKRSGFLSSGIEDAISICTCQKNLSKVVDFSERFWER